MACPDCFKGTLRGDVVPAGTEETVHGLATYVARPLDGATPLGIVVILADAFGWKLRNIRALADAYARRVPCVVYIPDVMDGHAPPESLMIRSEYTPPKTDALPLRAAKRITTTLTTVPALTSFLVRNRPSVIAPRVAAFMRAVRSSPSPSIDSDHDPNPNHPIPGSDSIPPRRIPKVAAAGFCWGGKYAIQLTHDIPGNKITLPLLPSPDGAGSAGEEEEIHVIDCAFAAHPTFVDVPGDIEKAVRPLSLANGEDDRWMGKEKWCVVKRILEGKNQPRDGDGDGGVGYMYEAVEYPGAKHGFAVRGDREDALQRERGERSEDQAVAWFRRFFC